MIRDANGVPLPYINREGRILHGPRCSHNTLPWRLLSGDENPLTSTRCSNCCYEPRTESNWQVVPMVMAVVAFMLIPAGAWWISADVMALAVLWFGAGLWAERWAERRELGG